jgi:hypothetical protein
MHLGYDTKEKGGVSVLTGLLKDQSELMGILNTLSQHHLEVTTVNKLENKKE